MINLYSSMDRLETGGIMYTDVLRINIYIPVWIDQKLIYCFTKARIKCIYIPVWIDQKPVLESACDVCRPNLHSSMDRLETQM